VIYLVRHGETDWNKLKIWQGNSDIPLNETGRAQANAIAKRLETVEIEAIYSSPLSRAFETARIIADYLNVDLTVMEDLSEGRINLWNGKNILEVLSEFKDEFEIWRTDPYAEINGVEPLANLQSRAVKSFKRIVLNHSDDSNIIIVSHALWLKSLICWILRMPLSENRRLRINNASITMVSYDRGEFYLESLNETWHLNNLSNLQNFGGVSYGESKDNRR
jgi:probable phosphoglycerate mutase